MQDPELLEGLERRDENALAALQTRYRAYCAYIAAKILGCEQSAQEVCNDVWLQVWRSIPPARPDDLRLYIGKAARNTALKYLERENAQKRSGVFVQLDELAQCIPDKLSAVEPEDLALKEALERFLRSLPQEQRRVFVRRYWYGDTVRELAERFDCAPTRITGILFRTRKQLKKYLEKEDIAL